MKRILIDRLLQVSEECVLAPHDRRRCRCSRKVERLLREHTKELEALTRRIIRTRACVCNAAGHRCGTNQMLEDLDAIVKVQPSEK